MRLTGIEAFVSGIPGTVGVAPVQNIGAYGQEVAETIVSLDAYDTQSKTLVSLSNDDCRFFVPATASFVDTEMGLLHQSHLSLFRLL